MINALNICTLGILCASDPSLWIEYRTSWSTYGEFPLHKGVVWPYRRQTPDFGVWHSYRSTSSNHRIWPEVIRPHIFLDLPLPLNEILPCVVYLASSLRKHMVVIPLDCRSGYTYPGIQSYLGTSYLGPTMQSRPSFSSCHVAWLTHLCMFPRKQYGSHFVIPTLILIPAFP